MNNNKYVVIGLLSTTLIALEMAWTRIFSAEFFYTFAFLIISLAILGLGLGSLALRIFPILNKKKLLPVFILMTGIISLLGPILIFKINLEFSGLFSNPLTIFKFLLTLLVLNSAFFTGGMAISTILKQNKDEIPKLYMADLIGAAIGVFIILLLMNLIGTPMATFLVPIPAFIASLLLFRKYFKLIPLCLVIIVFALTPFSKDLLQSERKERAPVSYTHWDAVAKIKIYDFNESYKGLNIDNAANSPCYGFDGNWDKPDSELFEFGIDIGYLINKTEDCNFLSLGAGGGVNVLQALQYGAKEIHAVEVIPHINYLMTKGNLADFTGNIYNDPRVKVVTEDARAYIRRFKNNFDIICSSSSNSFAALASGSFALAENYLFTTEAFRDYWLALSDNGFMVMEHQFYIPRVVSEFKDALKSIGIENPENHFAVYNLPGMRRKMILISKQPMTMDVLNNAFGDLDPKQHNWAYLLYPAPDSLKDNIINKIALEGWKANTSNVPVNISPCTDNRPFTAQMGLWKNLNISKLSKVLPYEFFGFPLSKLIILIILIIIIAVIIPLNLFPYLFRQPKLKPLPWIYFFLIGSAFMMLEVVLIQKYTMFIGSSVYCIATILITLLFFSGLGSLFSTNFKTATPFIGIFIWILLDILLFKHFVTFLGNFSMIPRILFSIVLLAPLSFFMGMPFPKAGLIVGDLIDWGFAVNGAASTFGATIVLLISFTYGFNFALIIGGILYLAAMFIISKREAW